MNQQIAQTVIELAAEQANCPAETISPAHHFINDLKFDSLDMVEFAMQIEDRFGLSVPDEAMQTLDTVGRAIEYVEKDAQPAPAAPAD